MAAIMLRLVLLLALLVTTVSAEGYVTLFGNNDDDCMKRVTTGPAQRCYAVSCFSDKAWKAKWTEIQTDSWVVFYENADCTGNYNLARGPEGTKILAYQYAPKFSVSSLMIWESGRYPTRGLVDYCSVERSTLLTRNVSDAVWNSSDSASTVGLDSAST